MRACCHEIATLAASAVILLSYPARAETDAASTAARLEALQKQLEVLQAEIAALKAAAKPTPVWRGAPQFSDGDSGFTFKPRGRLNYDVGFVENPGITTRNFGFSTRVRRARLGVEGSFPGDFLYKAEVDLADNSVSWADVFVEYKPDGPFSVRVGHHETFQGLEQMSSTRHIMFLERAQMNEAFNHARRLGASVALDAGDWLLRTGLFSDTINADIDNDEWLFGARLVYAPKLGDTQLHAGVSWQHREFPSSSLGFQYRARNPNRLTDFRLVDTTRFAAAGDDVLGVELAAIHGPFHVAAEAQWVTADIYPPGTVFDPTDNPAIERQATRDPSFASWYVEAGWWITGESRGYRKGEWDRTRVKNGFDKGGPGAFALTARFDRLDLSHPAIREGGLGTSASRGGKQDLYQLSLVWQPIDYVRVTTAYAHAAIEGGPFAEIVVPDTGEPVNARTYSHDSLAMRFAFDF